jgi:hypothetical protein
MRSVPIDYAVAFPAAALRRAAHRRKRPMTSTMFRILSAAVLIATLTGCAPEVGSERWCKKMRDVPKSDWSTNDATAYAKSCVFKTQD